METERRIDKKDDRKLLYFYKFLFPCDFVDLGKITNMRVGRCPLSDIREWKSVWIIIGCKVVGLLCAGAGAPERKREAKGNGGRPGRINKDAIC